MPPDKPTDIKARTWVIVVITVAVLALIGAIFNGAWIGLFGGDVTPESTETGSGNQDEIYALQTQVALQATLIAQREQISQIEDGSANQIPELSPTTQLQTFEIISEEVILPTSTPTSIPQQDDSEINATLLDNLFGSGNWFCFPDRTNGIGVKSLPVNFTVSSPLRYIDTYRGRFSVGDTEAGATGATVELISSLGANNCPSWQQDALSSWASSRTNRKQIQSGQDLDGYFGAGNWGCLSDYAFGARIYNLRSDLSIQFPFTTVDVFDGSKHGVGENIPAGGAATVWFAGSIPSNDCP